MKALLTLLVAFIVILTLISCKKEQQHDKINHNTKTEMREEVKELGQRTIYICFKAKTISIKEVKETPKFVYFELSCMDEEGYGSSTTYWCSKVTTVVSCFRGPSR